MNRTDRLDHRIEEALREIGNERQLSSAQRSRIRAAMIAAAQEQTRRRAQRRRGFRDIFWPRLLPAGLALASVSLIAFAAYILAGGAAGRPVAQAESSATFTLLHKHTAPLGIVWYTDRTVEPETRVLIAEGDILYAPQVVTVTFADQSIGLIQPDTEIAVLPAQRGLQLRFGQVDLAVQPAAQAGVNADAQPRFNVETRRANVGVKGTQFGVHSADDSDTVITVQGVVEVTRRGSSGMIFNTRVSAGEEVNLLDNTTAPPVVQLHAPLARVIEPGGRTIPAGVGTRAPEVNFAGSAYPGGVLSVDRPGLLITTPVDLQGWFTVPVRLPSIEGAYPFTLTIRAPDGRSRSGRLNIMVDKTAPNLAIDMPQISADGARIQIQGQTEPGSMITANGVELPVRSDGQFMGEVAMPLDRAIRVVARDFAGNESVLVQTIRP